MKRLAIAIPSRNEKFLQRTIQDVLEKATGEVEVYPILDGYEPPPEELVDDIRVHYIRLPQKSYTQKRHGINHMVNICKSNYVMSLDAHCMMAKGFDEVLIKDLADNEVALPRRQRLDAENWCIQIQSDGRPPIDYEYLMYPAKFDPPGFHGFKWDDRTYERWDTKVDETITMQASCWVMHKSWYNKNNFMQIEGYTGWGQEAEEISFTTWCRGGRLITNKNTWYAHLHKGKTYGRMYFMSKATTKKCNAYAYDFWVNNRLKNKVYNFEWLLARFSPMPNWPERDKWKL